MVNEVYKISKEEYEKAQKDGARSLITNPSLLYGYGVYSEEVIEKDGNYYLTFKRGSSCD